MEKVVTRSDLGFHGRSAAELAGQAAEPLAPEDRWLRRIRMMVLEQHERPVWHDAKQIVQLLQEAHADAIRWPTIVWAATFFDSAHLPKHSAAAGRDLLRELLDAARGTGIRVIPYCHIGVMHRETFAVHPEWAARARDGAALRWQELHYMHCLSNPDSMAAYCGAVREVVSGYDVPALYFDGPVWYALCYCHHCQAAFERRWGYPLPQHLSWSDESQAHYDEMRYSQVVAAMGLLRGAIRGAQGERRVAAMFNTGMTHASGRRNGSIPERVMAYADGCLSTEVHRRAADGSGDHGSHLGIVETVQLGASLRRVALCYAPPGPYESLVTHDSLDTELFGATYLALGGTPIVETARSFLFDRTGLPRVRALFEQMERHASLYYEAAPVRRTVVLYSRQTAEHYAQDDLTGRYGQHFSGALRALSHGHQAFTCLYDWHLCAAELEGVSTLILANATCLSDAQLDLIRDYVRSGGGLVATAETSLCDERGRRRPDFGLADLFGVSYRGTCAPGNYNGLQYREGEGYQPIPEAYLRWLDGAPASGAARDLAKDLPAAQLVPLSDAWWVGGAKAPPDYVLTAPLDSPAAGPKEGPGRTDHTPVAELYLPAGGAYGAPFTFPHGHPPGVVATTYGAGRAVYVASGVTRHYLRRGLRALRLLLKNAVDWTAGTPRPYRVDGPATLLTHMTRLEGAYPAGEDGATVETLALHLVNYTGDMHEHAAHRVEYVAPLRDLAVEVVVPDGRALRSVRRLLAGDTLPFTVESRTQDAAGGAASGVGRPSVQVARLSVPLLHVSETLLFALGASR